LNYQDTRYEMSIISDAFRSLFTSKQKDGENLQDYTRRFKASMEILESHLGGPLILEKYVRTMTGYDKTNDPRTDELIKHAAESLFAYLYLENADQDKYRTILNNLNSHKSLGNDQFPRTIVETNNVLSNHKFDVIKKKQDNENTHHPRANSHKNKEKDKESTPLLSFAQMEGRC
jgi:dsRNA-specific ribonuclease